MTTISNLAYSVQQGIKKHSTEFKQIFGVDLRKFMWNEFSSKITGFDIIAFNNWIEAGDRCCAEVVRERYGQRAKDLIREILEFPVVY